MQCSHNNTLLIIYIMIDLSSAKTKANLSYCCRRSCEMCFVCFNVYSLSIFFCVEFFKNYFVLLLFISVLLLLKSTLLLTFESQCTFRLKFLNYSFGENIELFMVFIVMFFWKVF